MNEEEKKAIELLEEIADEKCSTIGDDLSEKNAKTILNLIKRQQNQLEERVFLYNKLEIESEYLIKKQQKEIEQLANGIRVLGTNPDITTEEIIKEFTEKPISEEYMKKFSNSYISKDEVLKALGYEENDEEYERIYNKDELIISLIRTIFKECERLEDIEDQKTMLEIHNIENMRDKYWQEKIRNLLPKINGSIGHFKSENDNHIVKRIKRMLEDLLEE